jgi:electron transfer flavoprotein beta subunit
MGAARAVHVADDEMRGSDTRATVDVLAAALGKLEFDLAFVGADTSDGQGGVVGAAVAVRLGLPYLSYAQEIEPTAGGVRIHRITTTGYDVLEAPTPAVVMGTQLLGAPRYPALRGIMQARSKPVDSWSLADLGVSADSVGSGASTTKTLDSSKPPERAGATFVRESADVAVAQIVDFLASRRLI